MSSNRETRKWRSPRTVARAVRRVRNYHGDYWRSTIGHGSAPVPGRLLPLSKIGRRRRRRAGAR